MDESGFPKKGKHSVAVKRQYCGRLGKVENCQMGVFLGYTRDQYRILLDKSLFTFLEQDGIPWHNNTAENAIRHLAKQRDVSGNFGEHVTHSYLT